MAAFLSRGKQSRVLVVALLLARAIQGVVLERHYSRMVRRYFSGITVTWQIGNRQVASQWYYSGITVAWQIGKRQVVSQWYYSGIRVVESYGIGKSFGRPVVTCQSVGLLKVFIGA